MLCVSGGGGRAAGTGPERCSESQLPQGREHQGRLQSCDGHMTTSDSHMITLPPGVASCGDSSADAGTPSNPAT